MTRIIADSVTLFAPPDDLPLESGRRLGPITLSYETYGELNKDKSNAVLICHALSGDAHAAFGKKDKPEHLGWWDSLIGPGKAIDTDRYFVICSNTIGSCYGSTGPASLNPATGKPYGLTFPVITIGDMVNAQKGLIDFLGIDRLLAVVGGSMGGMQALEWAISYPARVKSCITVATAPYLSGQALAFNAVGREALMADANWQEGHYDKGHLPHKGLAIARMIGHITYRSDQSMAGRFGRKLQQKQDYEYDFKTDFQIESYLKYQGDKFVNRFDPNSYLYLAKAMSYFDLEKKYGSLEKAFGRTEARFLILSLTSDWLYPAEMSKQMVKVLMKLNKPVTYGEIDSPHGHDGFLIDNPQMNDIIRFFTESLNP